MTLKVLAKDACFEHWLQCLNLTFLDSDTPPGHGILPCHILPHSVALRSIIRPYLPWFTLHSQEKFSPIKCSLSCERKYSLMVLVSQKQLKEDSPQRIKSPFFWKYMAWNNHDLPIYYGILQNHRKNTRLETSICDLESSLCHLACLSHIISWLWVLLTITYENNTYFRPTVVKRNWKIMSKQILICIQNVWIF